MSKFVGGRRELEELDVIAAQKGAQFIRSVHPLSSSAKFIKEVLPHG
jgi:hypothetical protein